LPNSDLSHSKHTSGFNISMGSWSLVWKTKRQARVSNSICHGEYIAAELCLQEVKFINKQANIILGMVKSQSALYFERFGFALAKIFWLKALWRTKKLVPTQLEKKRKGAHFCYPYFVRKRLIPQIRVRMQVNDNNRNKYVTL
jgi:hypothetical protein